MKTSGLRGGRLIFIECLPTVERERHVQVGCEIFGRFPDVVLDGQNFVEIFALEVLAIDKGPGMDNVAAIFDAVRENLKVGIKVRTVEAA